MKAEHEKFSCIGNIVVFPSLIAFLCRKAVVCQLDKKMFLTQYIVMYQEKQTQYIVFVEFLVRIHGYRMFK
ncbi:hypothetical protein A8F95_02750 [Bacillus wudalianchiensis]|uniref:Uncharacterized protein n=1 Tax=Pseudobacillus wudalianchiensis TaxID=1743143 RepID=A0A1B9B965_9BACI|nr:hypothetical protein A8F95_02750 [Bacillus wudalianchiensis]